MLNGVPGALNGVLGGCSMGKSKQWVVYLLSCTDCSLYTGVTTDVIRRLNTHERGKGAKYTRSRLPVRLVAHTAPMSHREALQLEYKVRRLPRNQKVAEIKKYL